MVSQPAYYEANSVEAAARWIENVLLGQVGTTLAVLGVAIFGFSLLSGHMPVRSGLRAIVGCFLLFGASFIANALATLASPPSDVARAEPVQDEQITGAKPTLAPLSANPFDPYTPP